MPSAGAAGQSSAVSQNTLHSPEEGGWHAGKERKGERRERGREGKGERGGRKEGRRGGGGRERGRERDENSLSLS